MSLGVGQHFLKKCNRGGCWQAYFLKDSKILMFFKILKF